MSSLLAALCTLTMFSCQNNANNANGASAAAGTTTESGGMPTIVAASFDELYGRYKKMPMGVWTIDGESLLNGDKTYSANISEGELKKYFSYTSNGYSNEPYIKGNYYSVVGTYSVFAEFRYVLLFQKTVSTDAPEVINNEVYLYSFDKNGKVKSSVLVAYYTNIYEEAKPGQFISTRSFRHDQENGLAKATNTERCTGKEAGCQPVSVDLPFFYNEDGTVEYDNTGVN